jgi:hypothetical protein
LAADDIRSAADAATINRIVMNASLAEKHAQPEWLPGHGASYGGAGRRFQHRLKKAAAA